MSRKLRVTFVLPRTGEWPAGGLRIVYEHANYLSRRGHVVSVVHPGRLRINPTRLDHVKNAVRYALRRVDGRYTPDSWLKMDPKVRLLCVPSLSERFLPDGDVVIATAWETAEWVSQYSRTKGRGFYFIQHLETWNGPEERVYATWKGPLQKIVPSKWLAEIARDLGETAIYIPYGMDVDAFQILTPSEERRPTQLMMLYHDLEWKGCEEGLEAMFLVREREPDLRAILFGVPPRPETLPDWIEYHQKPSPQLLRELYNRAAIFRSSEQDRGLGSHRVRSSAVRGCSRRDGYRRAQGVCLSWANGVDKSCEIANRTCGEYSAINSRSCAAYPIGKKGLSICPKIYLGACINWLRGGTVCPRHGI